ncbi:hypothetical protein [Microlunatus sp. Gsoil 973]|uniref:hypothetical protein n=1 Tax=Microlunatus sp. Gsoil 973 TaxID=2672569 RepID=UPI0012B49A36|nr:hypothetical protein [Microlunatus sp. Gsoil 973]QGN34510.1 hypothetical protein GJV80_18695 [Microlunatus sp. Gsoil 973]
MADQGGSEDGAPRGAVWVDDDPVDPTWPEPSAPRFSRRRLLTVGIPVLALVLLIASVWALGGFAERDDRITEVARGKSFMNGPFEFSFDRATVQETDGYGKYKRIQKVLVTGTIRNTGDTAISPSGDWFVARPRQGTEVEEGQTARIGATDSFSAPEDVTPGLPATRLTVDFEFPPTFDDRTLLFAVGELSYGSHSYFSGDNDQFWDTGGGNAFRLQLPITRLAADDS